MKKLLKPISIALLVILIIIQFFRPEKNIAASNAAFANDITKVYAIPTQVQEILKASCYDCHSNNTKYPWYANVQPVAWWLSDHVEEGKKELNFSEFATFPIRRKYKKMEEIIDEVKEDEMPLSSYTVLHRYARLSKDQKNQLINWATSIRDTIKATYPADSLLRKK
ncbi:MAG: heme-binding domain-containing protein [Ferruginibacter sp.]